jgi:hypothetical protein
MKKGIVSGHHSPGQEVDLVRCKQQPNLVAGLGCRAWGKHSNGQPLKGNLQSGEASLKAALGDLTDQGLGMITSGNSDILWPADSHRSFHVRQRGMEVKGAGPEALSTNLSPEEVGGSEKGGDLLVGGPVKELIWAPRLSQPPRQKQGDSIADRKGFRLIVGDKEHGGSGLGLDFAQRVSHLLSEFRVKAAQGFIEKENRRFEDQTASQRHSLLLASGELVNPSLFKALQARNLKHFVDFLPSLAAALSPHLEPEVDVVENIQEREEQGLLEDQNRITPFSREMIDAAPIDQDLP